MTTTENDILNVTLLEPKLKHPTIFARFDALEDGQSITLLNDHDPKPLYYQLLGERGNIFTWQYLEQGPEWWKVTITRNMNAANEETLGEIAAKDLRKAKVFKKYGLDFCCGGKRTLKQACAAKGIDVVQVEKELQDEDKLPGIRPLPYNEWEAGFLCDFIVNTHHTYVTKNLPDIRFYADKVYKVHGIHHPELAEIHKLVVESQAELMSHMMKEERILFPYIKELSKATRGQESVHANHFGSVQSPINMMEMEHEVVGNNFEEIRRLTANYTLPSDACASYGMLYRMLQEFEEDLHVHIHLENNILFPKAIQLEKEAIA